MSDHPFEMRQPDQDYFQTVLMTVVGQAFDAAGYELAHEPIQWLSGRYRFVKALEGGWKAYIEFQVLVYTDNEYAARMPNRFQVMLIRSDKPGGKVSSGANYVRRSLSQLVVDDFGVAILPSAQHWWTFTDTITLGNALAEAGHLVVGYGMPWLQGELSPQQAADESPEDKASE